MSEKTTRGPPGPVPSATTSISRSNGERAISARLAIVPSLVAPSDARAFVEEVLIDHSRLSDLLLGISELVTNAVRHGDLHQELQLVVTVEARPNKVRLEVSYPGPLFVAPTGLPPPDVAAGRGLAIIDAIADRWGMLQSKDMVVWFEIDH